MSPKLPQVSGEEIIKLLKGMGYEVVRQRGSHIRLVKVTPVGVHKVTVPNHKEVAKGTLGNILSDVAMWNGISVEELIGKL